MKSGPSVSVIMPLYNKRLYVGSSIESVKKQTYPNWELIIVDDGSTDGSAELVPQDDRRIRLLRQPNRGPGAARNRGFQMASGDYIAFIDADDCYYPFKLEKEMDLLWNGKKAEWMMSAYDYLLNGETTRYYMKDINNTEIKDETLVFDDALNQLIVSGWPSDGLFMKRTLFEQLGGFAEKMRYGEITELILRCALLQPKVLICHVPLYLHIDVPRSTAKVSSHRIEYDRQMGESLYKLAKDYPNYSNFLLPRSRDYMFAYAAKQILSGMSEKGREFLSREFPFEKNLKWWKMWVASWFPRRLFHSLSHSRKIA